ncbi:21981_t:CDS:2, partial [Racocetra persica]
IHLDNNVNDKAHEDNYELPQILLTDILKTIESLEILEIWHLTFSCSTKSQFVILISDGSHRCICNIDNKIDNNQDFLMQHNPILLYIESSKNYAVTNHTFNLEHVKQLQGGKLYTPVLQNINNTWSKYGYTYGLMKKVINVAINSNSYDELIELCQQFLTNKQLALNKDDQSKNIPIANPIVSARRGRPLGRVKSDVEIQESNTKKHHCLSNTDTNI